MNFKKLQEIEATCGREENVETKSKSKKFRPDILLSGLNYLIRDLGKGSSDYIPVVRLPSLCENGSIVEQSTNLTHIIRNPRN